MAIQARPQIPFDVNNPQHVLAARRSIVQGRLDPNYRFHLEEGYASIATMVADKMAKAYMEMYARKYPQLVDGEAPKPADMVLEGTVISLRSAHKPLNQF